jgi:GNAT superfamily N-acetyltransferase
LIQIDGTDQEGFGTERETVSDRTEITSYEPSHRDAVVDVILPIQSDEFGVEITLADQPDLLDIPGFYQKGAGNFWLAVDRSSGDVVGTVALLDIGNAQAALRKMFVKPAYRGADKGVAAQLLATLFEWCAAKSISEVYLGTTSRFLAAHRFL